MKASPGHSHHRKVGGSPPVERASRDAQRPRRRRFSSRNSSLVSTPESRSSASSRSSAAIPFTTPPLSSDSVSLVVTFPRFRRGWFYSVGHDQAPRPRRAETSYRAQSG